MQNLWKLLVHNQTRRLKDSDISPDAFQASAAGFVQHYRSKILPKVQDFERRRIEALRRLRSNTLLALPLGFIGMIFIIYFAFYKMPDSAFDIMLFLGVSMVIGLFFWAVWPVMKYKESIKEQIYPLIFEYFGPDYAYSHVSPLTVSSLQSSDIIPSFDREKTDDYVRGIYKGVPLEMVEAELTQTRGSGKDRRTVTVFKGLLVVMGAHKNFKGKTLVKQDHGLMNWAVNGFCGLERVKLEDPEFEKQFEVFASDQVEARYLLTTSFMERLKKLAGIFNAKWVQCSFYSSRLLIMIPMDKDYFETSSVFTPATFIDEITRVLDEMKSFFDIIDTLKLNEKTGI
ncbi:MAG: DUF3137 domain-containing protein [Proteobacteria bacterium]|nr:DUF3137 domain-containing protein [Pseudomonadota bacterium]